mgnify:CR=1 FL=1
MAEKALAGKVPGPLLDAIAFHEGDVQHVLPGGGKTEHLGDQPSSEGLSSGDDGLALGAAIAEDLVHGAHRLGQMRESGV